MSQTQCKCGHSWLECECLPAPLAPRADEARQPACVDCGRTAGPTDGNHSLSRSGAEPWRCTEGKGCRARPSAPPSDPRPLEWLTDASGLPIPGTHNDRDYPPASSPADEDSNLHYIGTDWREVLNRNVTVALEFALGEMGDDPAAAAFVREALGECRRLLRAPAPRPERYAWHEEQERVLRLTLGPAAAILRDRRGGTTRPMTLREFRERIEAGHQPDLYDIGGCGCFIDNPSEAA